MFRNQKYLSVWQLGVKMIESGQFGGNFDFTGQLVEAFFVAKPINDESGAKPIPIREQLTVKITLVSVAITEQGFGVNPTNGRSGYANGHV